MNETAKAINEKHAMVASTISKSHVFDPRILENADGSQALWTSEAVELALVGLKDGYKLKESPFNKNVKDCHLRKGNLPFRYSEEELEIISMCMEDKLLFGNTFVQLKDGDEGWRQITLRPYQEQLLQQYTDEKWNLLMFPRQSGKTTTTVVEIVHFCTFNFDKDCVVIAQSELVVNEILQKIKNAFAGLPFYLQPGFISFTKKGFVLDNGCRLSIGVASESVVQGFSLDFLFIDEFAYIPSSRVNKFWNNIYPALVNNQNSRCIIASTPNGRNKFYELWSAAKLGNNRFATSHIYWWEVPRKGKPGQTQEQILEEFKIDTIANVGLEGWLMGFECSFDTQLNSIFHTKVQQALRKSQLDHEKDWSKNNHPSGNKLNIQYVKQSVIPYDLYEDYFIIGIDIAEGLGQDSTVMKVRKLFWNVEKKQLEYKLIGIFRDNEIPVEEFATFTLDYFKLFNPNRLRVVVETNNYGGEYFNQVDNLARYVPEYVGFDNVVFAKFMRASKNDFERGIRWDSSKKKTGVTSYKTLISNNIFDDTNSQSIDESLNFGRTSTGSYAAQFGHDDLVMSDVTIAYGIKINNLYSREYFLNAESALRVNANDIPEERKVELELIEREKNNVYRHRDFVLRNSANEVKLKQQRRRGGSGRGNGHYLN